MEWMVSLVCMHHRVTAGGRRLYKCQSQERGTFLLCGHNVTNVAPLSTLSVCLVVLPFPTSSSSASLPFHCRDRVYYHRARPPHRPHRPRLGDTHVKTWHTTPAVCCCRLYTLHSGLAAAPQLYHHCSTPCNTHPRRSSVRHEIPRILLALRSVVVEHHRT